MDRMSISTAVVLAWLISALAIQAHAQTVTAFEGMRLIVGDGRVVEKATLVVDGATIGFTVVGGEIVFSSDD